MKFAEQKKARKRCEYVQIFIINFEHISHLFLLFFFFADFKQVSVIWEIH